MWSAYCINDDSSLHINKLLSFEEDISLVIYTQVSFSNKTGFAESGKSREKRKF